jgi:hypothetical protein
MPREHGNCSCQSVEAGLALPSERKRLSIRDTALALGLVLPYLMPVGFYFLYQPINEEWTVKQFGCGCPRLDGTTHFNANHFNLILVGLVDGICIPWWLLSAERFIPAHFWPIAAVMGTATIIMVSLGVWARTVWL